MITKEDKELLLKDLCARLPYKVKARVYNHWRDDVQDETITIENLHRLIETFSIEDIKPYLFPLSSMTEEQKKELRKFDSLDAESTMSLGEWAIRLVDFYNKYHLDYRGFIEKGLAIDATGKNIY